MPTQTLGIRPHDGLSKPVRTARSAGNTGGRSDDERARSLAESIDSRLQPGLRRKRRCEHHRRSSKPSQLRAKVWIVLALRRGKLVRELKLFDRHVKIFDPKHHFCYTGPLLGSRFSTGIGPALARREIVNQERKKRAVSRTDLRGFPIQLDAVGPLTPVLSRLAR